jgi:DNA (cytosine-5)-methyltransferase 1
MSDEWFILVAMLKEYSVISLFAGVGAIDKGFESAGFLTVAANELDLRAAVSYKFNNKGVTVSYTKDIDQSAKKNNKLLEALNAKSGASAVKKHLVVGDVNNVTGVELLSHSSSKKVSVLTAGFPCQPFSVAGYRKGFADERGNVFWQIIRLVNELKPDVIFLENVKNLERHDDGNTLETILRAISEEINPQEAPDNFVKIYTPYHLPNAGVDGKQYRVLNSKDFLVPQNRERIFIIAFRSKAAAQKFAWPDTQNLPVGQLSDFIEFQEDKAKNYQYGSDNHYWKTLVPEVEKSGVVYQLRRVRVRENKSGLCPTLTANMGMGGHNVPLIRTINGVVRKLTPGECFKLMGYPTFEFSPVLTESSFYKQAGNAVVVPVIKALASQIKVAMS